MTLHILKENVYYGPGGPTLLKATENVYIH
jgi:hypothetical protein